MRSKFVDLVRRGWCESTGLFVFMALAISLATASSAPVHAEMLVNGFDIDTALGFSVEDVMSSAVKGITVGADHRPYMPATPLGTVIGLDVGVTTTVIRFSRDLYNQFGSFTDASNVPPIIPLPKLAVRKGIANSVDLGASGILYKKYFILGADLQFTYPNRIDRPTVALRASANFIQFSSYFKGQSYNADLLLSKRFGKRFLSVDPYIGVGGQVVHGEVNVPLKALASLPPQLEGVTITGNETFLAPRLFIGVPLRLGVLNLTAEYSKAAAADTLGVKVSIALDGEFGSLIQKDGHPNIGWEPVPLW